VPIFGVCTLIELMPVMTGSRADHSAQRFIGNPMPETCTVDDQHKMTAERFLISLVLWLSNLESTRNSVSPNYLRRPSFETTVL